MRKIPIDIISSVHGYFCINSIYTTRHMKGDCSSTLKDPGASIDILTSVKIGCLSCQYMEILTRRACLFRTRRACLFS